MSRGVMAIMARNMAFSLNGRNFRYEKEQL